MSLTRSHRALGELLLTVVSRYDERGPALGAPGRVAEWLEEAG